MTPWLASVVAGSVSQAPVRFCVGDAVDVLRAARLPKVEEVIGTGRVLRVSASDGDALYWIDGFWCARSARELRLVRRAR